jgi:hypothetical protein
MDRLQSKSSWAARQDRARLTLADVRAALEKAGVEFIAENGGGASVRLRKAKRKSK